MSDQETAAIIVLRTSDAKKAEVSWKDRFSRVELLLTDSWIFFPTQIEMNMSKSLNDLKDSIAKSTAFGPLPRDKQRIFHLGRELKTGGRSLSALGLGRFRFFRIFVRNIRQQGKLHIASFFVRLNSPAENPILR